MKSILDFFKFNIKYKNDRTFFVDNPSYKKVDYTVVGDNIKIELFRLGFGSLNINLVPKTIITKINKNIESSLNTLNEKHNKSITNNKNKWIYCNKYCNDIAELFKIEINSTIYILNILANSLITIDGSFVIFFLKTNLRDLTGDWEHDKQYIDLMIDNSRKNSNKAPHQKTRLIMGFGPSASGKTYCAKTIIEMLSLSDPSFPKSFLSIDGGIYREKSYIYHKLITLLKKKTYNGLKNLALSGITFTKKSLFDSGIVKKIVIKYLEQTENKTKFSLYVPETLSGCLPGIFLTNCSSIYKKYIDITDDSKSWIGLLIWQHKTHGECTYAKDSQCRGCVESGKKREKNEGKKYSSTTWGYSLKNGRREMMKAPGGRYEIHNGGGYEYNGKKTTSTIIDFSKKQIVNKAKIPDGFYYSYISPYSMMQMFSW
jgi:hypothetical protein